MLTYFLLGRCGSTLLSKSLDQFPTVQSISEPDVYTVLALHYDNKFSVFRNAQLSQDMLVTVTHVATLLLNNYFLFREREKTTICYKLRSEALDGAELLHVAVPNAKNIYMYRNCLSFSESCVRLVSGSYIVYWILSSLRLDAFYMWWIYKFRRSNRWFYEYMTASRKENNPFRSGFYWCFGYLWWINVRKALSLIQSMPNFFCAVLKYEHLVTRKQELIFQVAKGIGILDEEGSRKESELDSEISNVFTSNSQKGSVMASQRSLNTDDVWFGECEKHEINNVLQYLGGGVEGEDFVLPGTAI